MSATPESSKALMDTWGLLLDICVMTHHISDRNAEYGNVPESYKGRPSMSLVPQSDPPPLSRTKLFPFTIRPELTMEPAQLRGMMLYIQLLSNGQTPASSSTVNLEGSTEKICLPRPATT